MKTSLLKVLLISACCFVSVLQTEARCMDQTPWEREMDEGIRLRMCGKPLMDHVHDCLKGSRFPCIYKSGSLSELERNFAQKEFHQISTSNPAVAAMQHLITTALMQDIGCRPEVAQFVSEKAFKKLSTRINWDNESSSGPIKNTTINVYTPINYACHLLFSFNLSCYQLDVSYGGLSGLAGYKTFKMHNLQGTYGVYYFTTLPNQESLNNTKS